jgi:hypothetical protein
VTRDEAIKFIDTGRAQGIPDEELTAEVRKRSVMPPLVEYGPGGKAYPAGVGQYPGGYGYQQADAFNELISSPKAFAAHQVLPLLGAVLGGVGGRYATEAIPALRGAGILASAGRAAVPAAGEAAGIFGGTIGAQAASGEPIDAGQAGRAATLQGGLSLGNSLVANLLGRAGGVSGSAANAAMGRPGFAKVSAGAEDTLARRIAQQAENFPITEGRRRLDTLVAAHDQSGKFIDGEDIITAMKGAFRSGSSPEAVAANRMLDRDIANVRAEMQLVSRTNSSPASRVAASPGMDIPQESVAVPGIEVPSSGPTRLPPGAPSINERTGAPASMMQGSGGVSIPPGTRTLPGVSTPPSQAQTVPPHLLGAYGESTPFIGARNQSLPLTAKQTDELIQRTLTKPVQDELQGKIGASAYTAARLDARNAAAQTFYDRLGGNASQAASSTQAALKSREKIQKYFGTDQFGDPMLQTPGRIAAMGSPGNRSAPTLLKKLEEFDAVNGSHLKDEVIKLGQMREWGPAQQRTANIVSSALQLSRGEATGAIRNAIRGVARLAVSSQGMTGAAGRAGVSTYLTQKSFEDAMKGTP